MKNSFFILYSCLFLISISSQGQSQSSISDRTSKYHLNAKYFVDKNGNPCFTDEEINAIMDNHSNVDKYEIYKAVLKYGYKIPKIRGLVDRKRIDSLVSVREVTNEWQVQYTMATNDAVVVGKIIDINYLKNEKCLYYKTEYLLQVEKIFSSHFNLSVNDTVLLVGISGYEGGCTPKNRNNNIFSIDVESKSYYLNERNVFVLSHFNYYKFFVGLQLIKDKKDERIYQDEYCPRAFKLDMANDYFDISKKEIQHLLEKYSANYR